jgi:hypothetical protein
VGNKKLLAVLVAWLFGVALLIRLSTHTRLLKKSTLSLGSSSILFSSDLAKKTPAACKTSKFFVSLLNFTSYERK